ncbi:MAG: alpha-1,4-glucan--maltose-1-phosphate maltosyltransferase [Tepidisphaeraceae bacterium]
MNGNLANIAPVSAAQASARVPDRSLGQSRVVIEDVTPVVDAGRFYAKRAVGDTVRVEADAFVDGHDKIAVALLHRLGENDAWNEIDMAPTVNDRWAGEFDVHAVGLMQVSVAAWVDHFGTWRYDLNKRIAAGQDVGVDLIIGAELVEEAAKANEGDVKRQLDIAAEVMRSDNRGLATQMALDPALLDTMRRHAPRKFVSHWPTPLSIWVDRPKARFSSWYEFFPRSAANDPSKHGNLNDVINRLDYVAKMGFDVLYLPPIHPIGRAFRKGPNNNPNGQPGDHGSPWAIGGPEGGHDAIHPQLGTIEDFDRLVKECNARGIDLALDLAFQCSPDHPYVKQHPQWFKHRPDGTIQYAENPPKKYQDIYPFDFECSDFKALWDELLRVTLHWVKHGVRVFRVDNPHTKPFPFWEWLIAEVKKIEPDVLFLAEAFTRPKVMYRLAKLGFTQSYTYFAWRNDPWGLREYLNELTQQPVIDFFRPNVWPNTPDILPEYLQTNARAAYITRAVLAATLSSTYGVYGPAFELMEGRPVKHGSEEYLDSEKYQLRQWDLNNPYSLADLLGRLNRIRKENAALQFNTGLVFHKSDNDRVLVFSKTHGNNTIFVAANTDPYTTQWANLNLDLHKMGLDEHTPFQVHDLLTNERYRWQGWHAIVKLDPGSNPCHVFAVRRRAGTEAAFEYFV